MSQNILRLPFPVVGMWYAIIYIGQVIEALPKLIHSESSLYGLIKTQPRPEIVMTMLYYTRRTL